MIHFTIPIDGKLTRSWFYESWDEVPLPVFAKWQSLVPAILKEEEEFNDLQTQIAERIAAYEKVILSQYNLESAKNQLPKGDSIQDRRINKIKWQIRTLEKKRDKAKEARHKLEVQGVALFCNIPLHVLMDFVVDEYYLPAGMEDVPENWREVELTDKHINTYKSRLYMLSSSKLPTDEVSSFEFQSKTDAEIAEMKKEYKSLSVLKRIRKPGRKLAADIKKAVSTTYQIKDLWEHTTTLNKQFQDFANDIVRAMQGGDFTDLPALMAMLVVEGNEKSDIIERLGGNTDGQGYMENYMQEFKKLYEYRTKVFTEQERQFTVGMAIRVKNFFLPS